MNWEAVGAISEMVGSAAVVITIAYLAVQVKQSGKSARSATTNQSRAAVTDVLTGISVDTEASRIYARGVKDPNSLDAEERVRFDLIIYQTLRSAETLFWESREGLLGGEIWEAQWRTQRYLLNTTGGRQSWERQKSFLSTSFTKWVDRNLENPAISIDD
jgi:hypothetical protein